MKKKKVIIAIFVFTITLFAKSDVWAHPGNTASDGCHYCWTNCESWGEVQGERHCHGGSEEEGSSNIGTTLFGLGIVGGVCYLLAGKNNKSKK